MALRDTADIRTLVFTTIYFGLVAAGWSLHSDELTAINVSRSLLTIAAICMFSFIGAVATHNCVHSPMFKKRWMNRVWQVILTLTYGHPVSAFVPGHNLSHHRYTQSRKDVMRTNKVRFRWNFLNGLLFMPTVGKDITSADIAYFKAMRLAHPKWFRQLMIETAVFLTVMGALLVVDWKRFLLYVMIPHLYAAWGIITMNLLQHDGTDADTDFNHSRNFVGKLVNFWTYNNGYHTIHHIEAGLHWSLAPADHEKRVKPFMDPRLDEPSMPAYLWRTFGWPGRRLRYDGKPVIADPPGRDEPWIPLPEETPHEVSLGAGA